MNKNIVESLNTLIQMALNEAEDLQVGDHVVFKGSQPKSQKREGTITKVINNDIVEVEFPEDEKNQLMARTDRYYIDELEKL